MKQEKDMDLIWLKDVFFLIISRKKVDLLYGNVNVYIAEQKKLLPVTICDLKSIRIFVGYVEMGKNNCKNCKNCHEGCHSNCKLYLEFLEENERIKKVRHQETQKQSIKIESCRRRLQAGDHHRHWGALGYSRKERQK